MKKLKIIESNEKRDINPITDAGGTVVELDTSNHRVDATLECNGGHFKVHADTPAGVEALCQFIKDNCIHSTIDLLHDNKTRIQDDCTLLKDICYGLAYDAGWHSKPREPGTMIALIHSEISEAMEGVRKDLMDDHLPHRKMVEVEMADAVIRIMDFCGKYNLDIGGAIVEKLNYNTSRADHKLENRAKEGGKTF